MRHQSFSPSCVEYPLQLTSFLKFRIHHRIGIAHYPLFTLHIDLKIQELEKWIYTVKKVIASLRKPQS